MACRMRHDRSPAGNMTAFLNCMLIVYWLVSACRVVTRETVVQRSRLAREAYPELHATLGKISYRFQIALHKRDALA